MNHFLLSIIILISTAQQALCETTAVAPAVTENLSTSLKTHSSEPGFFTIVIALLFVICLIYITGLIYSKLNIIGANTVKKQLKDYDLSKVVVLSTTQLGQNRNLHVVEINGKKLLIGATQQCINLIKELDEVQEVGINEEKPNEHEVEIVDDFDLHKKYL